MARKMTRYSAMALVGLGITFMTTFSTATSAAAARAQKAACWKSYDACVANLTSRGSTRAHRECQRLTCATYSPRPGRGG
jgi:hypothetical protein